MKHIKFDGFNFTDVDNFIKNIEGCDEDSIHLNHEEGEVYSNGYYHKAPCHIIVNELTEELFVLPEKLVDFIIGENFCKDTTEFYKPKTFKEALNQGVSNLHVTCHDCSHKD
jgi:hypothetical protein